MKKYSTIRDINTHTQEGKLLLCAICCLTDDTFGPNQNRHPNDVLKILKEREFLMNCEETLEYH